MSSVLKSVKILLAVGVLVWLIGPAIAPDAGAAVTVTGRNSQIQVAGSANSEYGGWGYSPAPLASNSTVLPFIDSQSGSADAIGGGFHAESYADQVSSLSYDVFASLQRVSGDGLTRAHSHNPPPPPAGGAGAMGDSFFDVFFDVSLDPVPYTLEGSIDASGGDLSTYADVTLTRTGVGGFTIYSAHLDGTASGALSFSAAGVLDPGSYSLHMEGFSHNSSPDGTSRGSYGATLTVPEPSTVALLALGGIALLTLGWRRKKTRTS